MGAQHNLIRRPHGYGICRWCGAKRDRTYCYGGDLRPFCNVECFCDYHDVTRADYDFVEYKL